MEDISSTGHIYFKEARCSIYNLTFHFKDVNVSITMCGINYVGLWNNSNKIKIDLKR